MDNKSRSNDDLKPDGNLGSFLRGKGDGRGSNEDPSFSPKKLGIVVALGLVLLLLIWMLFLQGPKDEMPPVDKVEEPRIEEPVSIPLEEDYIQQEDEPVEPVEEAVEEPASEPVFYKVSLKEVDSEAELRRISALLDRLNIEYFVWPIVSSSGVPIRYRIQCGAFSSEEHAEKQREFLNSKGLSSLIMQ